MQPFISNPFFNQLVSSSVLKLHSSEQICSNNFQLSSRKKVEGWVRWTACQSSLLLTWLYLSAAV
jgi:hypothetical protein